MDHHDIKCILSNWGESPLEMSQVRGVYRIKTGQGMRCLKEGRKSLQRAQFMMEGMAFVQKRGFAQLANCVPTPEGSLVVPYQGSYYYLQEWVEGRELDYLNREDLLGAAKTLGCFHRASIGFTPQKGYEAKNKLGKWPKKLQDKSKDLERYLNVARTKANPDGFDRKVMLFGEWMLNHARVSVKNLADSHYADLVDEARDWGSLAHGDAAARNFIRQGRELVLIDFDAIAMDVNITDLWRLMRRALSRNNWEMELATEIMDSYDQFVPLESRHKEVLGAFLQFPEIPWRLLREYYEKENRTPQHDLYLTERLENCLDQHRAIDKFLKNFV
ncbi:CotS family spore coat protein [Dehalobacterium formicoaceticum]|uniref:CotS family spore coat protein n=1 Tax=Dehalobacterium formicoaceticum TaxID=51515 RepID=A0ABT1Y371_9FIRM|nr:CotS family spore coat protein [Dehalobacterium formicoaceticum]MCR6545317.1 CotS family spore coat protein [Dehalobacterium formicoaceticum]